MEKEKKSRGWYAIEWTAADESDQVHCFTSKGLRDAFVAGKAASGNKREVASATQAIVASMLVEDIPIGDPTLSRAIELQRDCAFLAGRLMLLAGDVPAGSALLMQSNLFGAPCAELADERRSQIAALLSQSGPRGHE